MAEFDITAKIVETLQDYNYDVADAVDKAATDCAKEMAKEIRATAPRRTGAYAKGWRSKVTQNPGRGQKVLTVYNATDYQLAHLLEKPHKKRNNRGTVQPHPHIAPANEKWQAEFERRCKEACKK